MSWDNPLSVAGEALSSVAGRILSFFAICWLATGAALFVEHGSTPNWLDLPPLLNIPVAWLILTLGSLLQGWGLLTVFFLGIAFVYLVHWEKSPLMCLLFVFLVQSAATLVPFLVGGMPSSTDTRAFVGAWLLLFILWVLLLLTRDQTLRIGPLTRSITWRGLAADEEHADDERH